MDRSDVINLISVTSTRNSKGVYVDQETSKQVFVNVSSVNSNEFFQGGANGLKPQYRFTMFEYDYAGETLLVYKNVRYSIYRTYLGTNDTIELYAEEDKGA